MKLRKRVLKALLSMTHDPKEKGTDRHNLRRVFARVVKDGGVELAATNGAGLVVACVEASENHLAAPGWAAAFERSGIKALAGRMTDTQREERSDAAYLLDGAGENDAPFDGFTIGIPVGERALADPRRIEVKAHPAEEYPKIDQVTPLWEAAFSITVGARLMADVFGALADMVETFPPTGTSPSGYKQWPGVLVEFRAPDKALRLSVTDPKTGRQIARAVVMPKQPVKQEPSSPAAVETRLNHLRSKAAVRRAEAAKEGT